MILKLILEKIHLLKIFNKVFNCYILFSFIVLLKEKNNEQAYIDSNEFAKKIGITQINKRSICNIYASLREKLRVSMHNKWTN